MVTGRVSQRSGRVPLALASVIQTDDIPFILPHRNPPQVLRNESDPTTTRYKPPARRLFDTLQECVDLDRELKILETSGHTRVGAFAKPLATKQKSAASSKSIKSAKRSSSSRTSEIEDNDVESIDEDESTDPFIHQFYDDQGRTLSEQLLRGRMRALALVKLVHGHHSTSKARAELELAEVYARLNLWKQADMHASCAASLLHNIELEAQKQRDEAVNKGGQKENGRLLQLALEFFYQVQNDEATRGRVVVDELLAYLYQDEDSAARNQLLTAVFGQHSLESVLGAEQTLHWQQLLLQLEAESEALQQHLTFVAARLPPGVAQMLSTLFTSLDTAQDGIVPFHTFIDRLKSVSSDFSNRRSSAALYVQTLCTTLQRVLNRVRYHSLTWAEILTLGTNGNLQLPVNNEDATLDDDSPNVLMSRVKLLLSQVYLRRGQLEEAVRYAQMALVAREQINPDSVELVSYYLVVAEALARRGRQLRVLGRQARRDRAENWLKSTEGSRCLRSRALEELELASGGGAVLLTKKEAEARARASLLQELTIKSPPSSLSTSRSGIDYEATARSLMDDALENCNKAWELQERFLGGDHVTTAAVHISLAQVHLLRCEDQGINESTELASEEAIRCFVAAIDIFEKACSGPVPASAFLHLELAKLYQKKNKMDDARTEYKLVGQFFASFAGEFAGSESTKRECCALALDAFQQWLSITKSTRSEVSSSLEDQRAVLSEMYAACVAGYGEFSMEACESAAELAKMLHRIATTSDGQFAPHDEIRDKLRTAVKLLRSASYIAEAILGAGDRRSKKLRKDALEVELELRSTVAGDEEDVGASHDWLTI